MKTLNEQISRMKTMMGLSESRGQSIAAGVLPYCDTTKRFLVGLRSSYVDSPFTWAGFGGAVERGEDLEEAVLRELEEEVGFYGSMKLLEGYVYRESGFEYHNFVGVVSEEFEPHLNEETDEAKWISYEELLELPHKHMGLVKFLKESRGLFDSLV